jgi:hypothetical protein
MSRRPATFRQRDVKAALKAAFAAGAETARVELDRDGHLVIVASRPRQPSPRGDDWDQAIADLERR